MAMINLLYLRFVSISNILGSQVNAELFILTPIHYPYLSHHINLIILQNLVLKWKWNVEDNHSINQHLFSSSDHIIFINHYLIKGHQGKKIIKIIWKQISTVHIINQFHLFQKNLSVLALDNCVLTHCCPERPRFPKHQASTLTWFAGSINQKSGCIDQGNRVLSGATDYNSHFRGGAVGLSGQHWVNYKLIIKFLKKVNTLRLGKRQAGLEKSFDLKLEMRWSGKLRASFFKSK